jgi:hypothetical protein
LTRVHHSARRRRRLALAGALAVAVLIALAAGALPGAGGSSRAAGAGASAPVEPTPQTDDSVPAREVTMIGATPAETGAGADETWGVGRGAGGSGSAVVVRYAAGSGGGGEWSLGPPLLDEAGQPLTGFELDTPEALGTATGASPLAGQLTPDGAGVLAGYAGGRALLLVRAPDDPAGAFQATDPSAESQLQANEQLLSQTRAPLIAPLDEGGGAAGALVVPVRERNAGVEEAVLHWDGATRTWTREPIELPSTASPTEFRVLGIGASSPENAWLVAQLSAGALALFQRQPGAGGAASWVPVALRAGGTPGEPLSVAGEQLTVPGARKEEVRTQVLTVTAQGVWIDGERPEVDASTTLFFQPAGGGVPTVTSWCTLEDAPAGTVPCQHPLPQALPSGTSRSIGWATSASACGEPGISRPYGERVITGLPEGVSLRLEGEEFVPVLALGGTAGAAYGAAFADPCEGWLGNYALPVHLTLAPQPSALVPWPVSFHHALLAIAPQPGTPAGALSSEALAVGDLGAVARFRSGQGWVPESLLGPDGRRQAPRLRAVAWPTPNRAYAVGDEGAMWMWRGEAGAWEPDLAAPRGFEGNLLGVAFDPADPARGYAVGEGGVLLGYGKTWTQALPAGSPCPSAAASSNSCEAQTQQELPAESPCPPAVAQSSNRCTWADASFTSIAFAGSEALVAYRLLPATDTNRYVGGVIVNDGSGWHVDTEVAEAIGANVPWALAGLPDGGAALGAAGAVYEREGPGAPWLATSTPFPGSGEPGSLTLFREGGALRVLASGSAPDTYPVESAPEAPPGFPPAVVKPYPLASGGETGLLRQTAGGWRDEEHELNNAAAPPGDWSSYDMVYQPDPVFATLVSPSGGEGWAVGGQVEGEEHGGVLDTADAERYGGEPVAPLGSGEAPVTVQPGQAAFAIGGGAQCAAPCAARAAARIGPDVWLRDALARAVIPGVRAFLYTGPRVADRHALSGPQVGADRFSYETELGRYAALLESGPLPAFAAAAPADLDYGESELSFAGAFVGAPAPFGAQAAAAELAPAPGNLGEAQRRACAARGGCQAAYYALESTGATGAVRVVVLDETTAVSAEQCEWLARELLGAKAAGRPAIVLGDVGLGGQTAACGAPGTRALRQILVQDGASAYFFDSPEENVTEAVEYERESIPAFGSGTLGYVNYQRQGGGGGFLLAEVDVAARDPASNRAPVVVRLIPAIEELALEAQAGTLLRLDQAAQFAALARRPRAGNRTFGGGAPHPETSPYIPIPAVCQGEAQCNGAILPEYAFRSSNEAVGRFVGRDLASAEPNAVALLPDGEPNLQSEPRSGFFCALAPGQTTVTVQAGGLSASLVVTVQAGTPGKPCGVRHVATHPPSLAAAISPLAPAPAGAAPSSAPTETPPLPPAPVPVTAVPAPAPAHAPAPAAPSFPLAAAPSAPLLVAVPPPLPTPARPTPPSGTSAVTSPVEVAQREEEQEEATESVRNQAVAYRASDYVPAPAYVIGLIVLAAAAGASARRRPRGGRRGAALAQVRASQPYTPTTTRRETGT